MKDSWKTVRIFISSTFKDMQAERDHLVRFVFPKLREELIKYRIHLVDVDLRWGVTSDEDAYDVCMEEIDNCKPRFICILGGRYGWIPPESDISITASEVHYGALDRLDKPIFRYFYFRNSNVTNSIPEEFEEDYREPAGSKSEKLLESLKERIMDPDTKGKVLVAPGVEECKSLPYYVYPCRWDENLKRIVNLESFGNQVYNDIMDSIKAEFGKVEREPLNEFEEENAAIEAFIEEKTENYITGSRKAVIKNLCDFANGKTGNNYSILYGDPGTGKTALMAKFYQEYTELGISSDKFIIPHFIGASAKSTDIRLILRRFCYELSKSSDSDEEIPEDYNGLIERFNSLLNEVSNNKPVVILIDAINQLQSSENRFDISWLPSKLPENVHIMISTLSGIVLDSFQNSQLDFEEIELPVLEPDDSKAIIDNFLQRYRKKFDSEQKLALMNKEDSNNPLYLLAALEEIRTLGTYEEITKRIHDLPERVCPLFKWILKRLEQDQGFNDNGEHIGERLVSDFVSLIGVSRHGLSQVELIELIDPGDPQGNIAALQRLLRPHLMFKGELVDFYHGQLLEAVEHEYLSEEDDRLKFHQKLAEYFHKKADPESNFSWKGKNSHALSELPYHQTSSEKWKELEDTLCDLRFIEAKCAVGMTYNLIEDYNLALDMHPEAQEEKQKKIKHEKRVDKYINDLIDYSEGKIDHLEIIPSVRIWSEEEIRMDSQRIIGNPTSLDNINAFSDFVNLQSHLLFKFGYLPGFCYQRACNYSNLSPISRSAKKIFREYEHEPLILRDEKWLSKYNPYPLLKKILEGHKNDISSIVITPDGKKAVSGCTGGIVHFWDLETGKSQKMEMRINATFSVAAISDVVKKSLSTNLDDGIGIWDLEVKKLIKLLGEHYSDVNDVAITPNGKKAITGHIDNNVRFWDLEKGKSKILIGHKNSVKAVAITPDGRKAISGCLDRTVQVWDLETGNSLKTLNLDTQMIFAVDITIDGNKAIFNKDYILFFWDLEAGKILKKLRGHTDYIDAVAITPDGKKAISGGRDRTVRFWDLEKGELLKTLKGHTDLINAVAITPEGKMAVSGCRDKTVRVWNLETGKSQEMKGLINAELHTEVTSDGIQKLIYGNLDGNLGVWDLKSGILQKTMGHLSIIHTIDITPDKKKAITGSMDNTVRIWNLNTGKQLKILELNITWVTELAITPDGKKVVIGNFLDNNIYFLDLEIGELKSLKGHKEAILSVCVTPDGKKAISGSMDNTICVWDLETFEQLKTLYGHKEPINAAAITPNGKMVLSGSDDNTVCVWDLETGKLLKKLEGHSEKVNTIAITPDSKKAISGSDDNNVRVWDLETGKCLKLFDGFINGVYSSIITPDGKIVITGSSNIIHIWDLETGNLICFNIEKSCIGPLAIKDINSFVFRDGSGKIILSHLVNVPLGSPIVTATRLWLSEENKWDKDIKANCKFCGKHFKVKKDILNAIREIEKLYKKPNGWIADEAWEDPRLISECPYCQEKLKFNPFVVDNKEEELEETENSDDLEKIDTKNDEIDVESNYEIPKDLEELNDSHFKEESEESQINEKIKVNLYVVTDEYTGPIITTLYSTHSQDLLTNTNFIERFESPKLITDKELRVYYLKERRFIEKTYGEEGISKCDVLILTDKKEHEIEAIMDKLIKSNPPKTLKKSRWKFWK